MTPKRTKTVKPELLPCPFCGSFAIDGTIKGVEFYAVICHNCGASTGYKKKGDDAIAAWNRRTNRKGKK